MAGRHGGRESDYAGTRDFVPESVTSTLVRHSGRWGGRENGRDLGMDQEGCEWITVRYGIWRGLEIGKTYKFNGRRGKVIQKRENAGVHNKAGIPRVCVEWKN